MPALECISAMLVSQALRVLLADFVYPQAFAMINASLTSITHGFKSKGVLLSSDNIYPYDSYSEVF